MGIENRPRSNQHVMSDPTAAPEPRIGIRELILQVQARTGLGFAALSERARKAGRPITKQTINDIAAGRFTRYPSTDMIRGLSEALAVPAMAIVDALSVSLGLHVYVPTTIEDDDVTLISREPLLPGQAQVMRVKVRKAAAAELARIVRESSGQ